MSFQKTLVLVKPDGVKRHLVGKIITRFEDAGLKMIGMKMVWADENFSNKHYRQDIEEKYGKKIRDNLIKYIRTGPVVAIVFEGVEAIAVVRKLVGATYPNESLPGTIRGDFSHISKDFANSKGINVKNLVHSSANADDAKKEVELWFSKKELHSYKTMHDFIHLDEISDES